MARWLGTIVLLVLLVPLAPTTPAHAQAAQRSLARASAEHLRVVTFSFATRGRIRTSVRTFKRQVRQTYADQRGWRRAGVRFQEVRRHADLVVVLAEPRTVPSYSSGCSAYWSCRVGRFVVINQARWRFATPPWNRAGRSLRDYRRLAVNHETGHFLGHHHVGCPGRGRRAPVMMTQSKGLHGCRFNPWPTNAEVR
ncbi:MAG TPA: DUF3152 domain-containing protein [Nocardioides sp.]|nr:DUF3152 domain-containing protein [Nocardioides sp.]